jgi:hypothetical protein
VPTVLAHPHLSCVASSRVATPALSGAPASLKELACCGQYRKPQMLPASGVMQQASLFVMQRGREPVPWGDGHAAVMAEPKLACACISGRRAARAAWQARSG